MQQNRKIIPVILCGGSGSRLSLNNKNNTPKQFINFGNWTLLGKTLERIKSNIFDTPLISTNLKYFKEIKKHLIKHKIKNYKIILEPKKKKYCACYCLCCFVKRGSCASTFNFFLIRSSY